MKMNSSKRVYLDYASATPLDPRVGEVMESCWTNCFANPSAIHADGLEARRLVDEAREGVATLVGARIQEVVFTGGGTESDNLAILGVVSAYRERNPGCIPHVVTSAFEHEAVLAPLGCLEKRGWAKVTRVLPGTGGVMRVEDIITAITGDTVLVSIMAVQNEIGTIQPIREIAKALRKWKIDHGGPTREVSEGATAQYPYFHTDACQLPGVGDVFVPRLGVDLLTLNASKISGPKGVGLLVVRAGVVIDPILFGGGHEGGMRPGTENAPGIVGFAKALALTLEDQPSEIARLSVLRNRLLCGLQDLLPDVIVNGDLNMRSANNINVTYPGADHEFIALGLDAHGISVATKSACSELGDAETSHVLSALREGDGRLDLPASGIRMTLGRETTEEDIDRTRDAWKSMKESGNYFRT